MQDIFEKIDNFRGGDGGAVKLKDLIRFLRGVCENIDQNFKVGAFPKTTILFFCVSPGQAGGGGRLVWGGGGCF